MIGATERASHAAARRLGMVRAKEGRVVFLGEDVTRQNPAGIVSRGLVHCPEGRRIFSNMTVRENLELGAYLRRDRDGIARDTEHALTLFPRLRERLQQNAGTLSGGEQQMLAIRPGAPDKTKTADAGRAVARDSHRTWCENLPYC
jgi:branched-chain amino acid transport system ATP-binding protein